MKEPDQKPYDRLLQGVRAGGTRVPGRTLDEEADSDRGRVLFSAPFRRLQGKAQVFSLESNAAIRSKLSHSLEVSSIGRYIAQQVLREAAEKGLAEPLGLSGKERAFITFVETACLLHDIGNPPYGHFGELAIGEWFRRHQEEIRQSGVLRHLSDAAQHQWYQHCLDLMNFDGNAQGFRIMVRLQQEREMPPNDRFGANLTLTQLAAGLKYPRTSAEANSLRPGSKGSYFTTEARIVERIRETLGVKPGQRHPLVYVMEAADDVAYCLSDLEDGIEKGLVDPQELAKELANALGSTDLSDPSEKHELDNVRKAITFILDDACRDSLYEVFWDFRSAAIRLLVRRAARNYVGRHDSLLSGTANALLRDEEPESVLLGCLKDYASRQLYCSAECRNREITAFAVLHGIMDAYRPLLTCDGARLEAILSGRVCDGHDARITVEASLANRIPEKYVDTYHAGLGEDRDAAIPLAVWEWALRAHLIVDYISGMTDDFALSTHQLIAGTRIGGAQ